jgi:NAD(P)-dependent dehydrogenase (short-subunit alcohol dehydrogenase family)
MLIVWIYFLKIICKRGNEELNFIGKNILVVGGTSGIGYRLVENLIRDEAGVWVWGRREPDVSTERSESVDISKAFGDNPPEVPSPLHGLVYCPGSMHLLPFSRLKEEDFLQDFNINVMGAVRVIQRCLPSLLKAEGASVVLLSTVAARIGMAYHTSIASAKSALEGLAKSLAAEYSSKLVRVNVVSPSLTDTPLAGNLLSTEEKRERAALRHPLGRIGKPDDIAWTVEFLLSEKASWITGQILSVDGGMSSIKLFS